MSEITYGIRITGDASGAKKAFEDTKRAQEGLTGAGKENARAGAELERGNERQAAALGRLRIAALAAGAAMLAMLRSTVNAAIEAERSIARLNAVWLATGGTSGLSRGQQEALVQRMAGTTRFDDESIRNAMGVLSTFRQVSGQAFDDTMKMATGMAEVLGTDLQSAVVMLGKALEDPVNGLDALARVGVKFNDGQKEVIKNLVETGRAAEAQQIILRELKSKGFDTVAEAMNKGMSRATSDLRKEWNEFLESLGGTKAVQTPVTDSLGAVRNALWAIRNVIEGGSWVDSLKQIILTDKPSNRVPAADDNSPEAAAARLAAQQAKWQAAFDAQQAQAREFLKKRDEEAKKELPQVLADTGAALAAQNEILEEARALGVEFLKLQQEKRLALEKEGEAVRDVLNPWNAYAREVERLRALMEKGAITQREFGEAVATEARKVGGAVEDMADKGVQGFDELKEAIEGWGRDLSRELARGEVSLRSFGRLFEELLAMQIQKRLMQPFLTKGTELLDSLFNTTGVQSASQMAAYQAAGAYTGNAAPFHAGGIAGLEGGARRYVHPAYFERAPRLHSGGLTGNEVPAILQRGEGVFTREQMRAMGGGNVTIKVINETGVPAQGEASAPRVDASGMAVDLVLRRLAVDGGARQQLRGMLAKPEH